MAEDLIQMNFRMTEDTRDKLRDLAWIKRISMTQVINDMIGYEWDMASEQIAEWRNR